VQIVQRHHFASHLKRMAVVVRTQEEFLAFVKVSCLCFSYELLDLNKFGKQFTDLRY
jgi:cation-transporting ATPase 13A1